MKIRLDSQLTDEEFAAFERELTQMNRHEVADILAFSERIHLEGAVFGEECSGCVHQAANGLRAATLARAALDRR
jgi:hypothetical protein